MISFTQQNTMRLKSSLFALIIGFSSQTTAFRGVLHPFGRSVQLPRDSVHFFALKLNQNDVTTIPAKEGIAEANKKFWWDKDAPKTSLSRPDIQQSHTAAPWILNLTELLHWVYAVPAFAGSYAIMLNIDFWMNDMFDGSPMRALLWCLSPTITFCAALFPMLCHIYEDWQIAPFRDPYEMTMAANTIRDYNNDRLRQIGMNLLFLGLSVSFLMMYHGYAGFDLLPVSVIFFLYACIGDKNHLVSQYIPKEWSATEGEEIAKVSVSVAVLLMYAVVLASITSLSLASDLESSLAVKVALVGGYPLVGVGGFCEGVVTESTFRQWDHVIAVTLINGGMVLEAWALFQIG